MAHKNYPTMISDMHLHGSGNVIAVVLPYGQPQRDVNATVGLSKALAESIKGGQQTAVRGVVARVSPDGTSISFIGDAETDGRRGRYNCGKSTTKSPFKFSFSATDGTQIDFTVSFFSSKSAYYWSTPKTKTDIPANHVPIASMKSSGKPLNAGISKSPRGSHQLGHLLKDEILKKLHSLSKQEQSLRSILRTI